MSTATTPDISPLEAFQWSRHPETEAFLRAMMDDFLARCPFAADLARRMHDDTGTRFFDWIDCLVLHDTPELRRRLAALGYQQEAECFRNPEGVFPRIILAAPDETRVVLKVDSVADFLAANQIETEISGEPFAPLRRAVAASAAGAHLDVAEHRGTWSYSAPALAAGRGMRAAVHLERFRMRRRSFGTDAEGFAHACALADDAVRELGIDAACAHFFAAEREYWQRRNRAAQAQYHAQQTLGLGWGNHDHHTYRSSRACFAQLVAFFEALGLECRERFYAGREAGWGAQVMENVRAGIVVFADVDLAPEELLQDFAHEPLAPRDSLGTVGLWCGLHGEAFLQAGMHHLECQFDFAALARRMRDTHGIGVMKPFTDFPYLRQAFTEGERWPVSEPRIARLLAQHLITAPQAETFRREGAIGSHLENLERNEGYKGFNQKGVSEIIAATDPRRIATR